MQPYEEKTNVGEFYVYRISGVSLEEELSEYFLFNYKQIY
jgi:hypothetical protein